jgi:hypothetical protein
MPGRDLDDQLRVEAINGYSLPLGPCGPARLKQFYDKTDSGR